MKYSIIITEREEKENAKRTIRNIKDTQKGDYEIVAISDVSVNGPAFCRNEGINRAKNDIIIIIDAHMRFRSGALDMTAEYIAENPNKISCLICYHNPQMSFSGIPKTGAAFHRTFENDRFHEVLKARWRQERQTGAIPCIMGACYGLTRQNYYGNLKAPLRLCKGWGCDEEILSITNWLCGGESVLLPFECAHMARNQSEIPYRLTKKDTFGVCYNRFLMLKMIPMPEAEAEELEEWLLNSRDYQVNYENIIAELAINESEINKNNFHYIDQIRNYADFKREFLTTERTDMKQSRTQRQERKRPEPNIVVRDTGTPCPHCGSAYDHKTTHVYPNGNRRKLCGMCNRPFVAKRVSINIS